jgi:hypothetical protein
MEDGARSGLLEGHFALELSKEENVQHRRLQQMATLSLPAHRSRYKNVCSDLC